MTALDSKIADRDTELRDIEASYMALQKTVRTRNIVTLNITYNILREKDQQQEKN